VHPAPTGSISVPTPIRVSTRRTGVSAVNRLAVLSAVCPTIRSASRPLHGSDGPPGVGAGVGLPPGLSAAPRTWNQFDFRPNFDRNAAPVTVTDPPVPTTSIESTRPPHSPLPSRDVTTMPV
jgi:hypothetical protein